MGSQYSSYEQRCEEELAAANGASSHEEWVAHLEQAIHLAQLASRARQNEKVVNLARWREERA